MFHLRLISAIALISLLVAVVWLDYWYPLFGVAGLWMWPLGFYAALATAAEFTKLAQSGGHVLSRPAIMVAVGCVYLISSVPLLWGFSGERYPADCPVGIVGWPALALPISLFAMSAYQMMSYTNDGKGLERISIAGMVVLYVGGCCSFWVILRTQSPPQWSLLTLVGIIAVTKLADIGAYVSGKLTGRNKLCPKISPGKTWEGLFGGFLFAALGSWVYFYQFVPWMQPTLPMTLGHFGPILLALLLTLTGLVGDLTESLIKRDVGSKDSGHLLPGMGGVWDVTDSLLPTAVIGFLGVVAGLVPQPA
jgi:phosphatidate cytidylyltransferase